MTSVKPISFHLSRGYKDPETKIVHREMTFERRLTGQDMFALDNNPLAESPTQYNLLVVRSAISRFGSLPLPVPLEILLSLTRTDSEDLINTYNRFARESAGERQPDFISSSKMRLSFGFNLNSVVYDLVEFGEEATGFDEVAAESMGLKGVAQECYLMGREIKKLSQSNGPATLDGPINLELFNSLDAADIVNLRIGSAAWRNSFRTQGDQLQRGDGAGSAGAGDKDGMDRGVHSESPDSEA